jgi:hypothetical protein
MACPVYEDTVPVRSRHKAGDPVSYYPQPEDGNHGTCRGKDPHSSPVQNLPLVPGQIVRFRIPGRTLSRFLVLPGTKRARWNACTPPDQEDENRIMTAVSGMPIAVLHAG